MVAVSFVLAYDQPGHDRWILWMEKRSLIDDPIKLATLAPVFSSITLTCLSAPDNLALP